MKREPLGEDKVDKIVRYVRRIRWVSHPGEDRVLNLHDGNSTAEKELRYWEDYREGGFPTQRERVARADRRLRFSVFPSVNQHHAGCPIVERVQRQIGDVLLGPPGS